MLHLARRVPASLALALLLTCPPAADGQGRIDAKVHLGANDELEIDARYDDPGDVDARVKGTRVIPMWVKARIGSAPSPTSG